MTSIVVRHHERIGTSDSASQYLTIDGVDAICHARFERPELCRHGSCCPRFATTLFTFEYIDGKPSGLFAERLCDEHTALRIRGNEIDDRRQYKQRIVTHALSRSIAAVDSEEATVIEVLLAQLRSMLLDAFVSGCRIDAQRAELAA